MNKNNHEITFMTKDIMQKIKQAGAEQYKLGSSWG
jgi:hypothetical protein